VARVVRVVLAVGASIGVLGQVTQNAVAQNPTSGRCAGAWNQAAPSAVRATVRTHHVRQATAKDISGTSVGISWTLSGNAVPKAQRPTHGCVIVFFLSGHRTLTLIGTWKNGTIGVWNPPLYSSAAAGSGNACVRSNGDIYGVGRFTASSRCP